MKRLLSRCLVSVLVITLLVASSSIANAEELQGDKITGYEIRQDIYIIYPNGTPYEEWWGEFTPNDGTVQKEQHEFDYILFKKLVGLQLEFRTVWNILFADNSFPFVKGQLSRVTMDNFYFSYLIEDEFGFKYVTELCDFDEIYIQIKYTDNTEETIVPTITYDTNKSVDMYFEFTPTANVKEFVIVCDSIIVPHINNGNYEDSEIILTAYIGEYNGDNSHDFIIEVQTEEEKLLGGILGWLKEIFNKIGNIGDYIIELPVNLWNTISNGLINLFVPSDTDIMSLKDRFDQLMHDKFGILYDCKAIFDGLLDSVATASTTYDTRTSNSIVIPETTIPLPGGNEFTFGGQQVQIIPTGFEFLQEMCRMVISIIATFAVLNLGRNTLLKIIGAH